MRRASQFFSDDQKQEIRKAVGEAESRTSAEIIPAVATASGRYDRAEDIIGLWAGLVLMLAAKLLFFRGGTEAVDWGFSFANCELLVLVVAVVVGFIAGAVVGSRVGWLRHLFTPSREMREEVSEKARQVFFDSRVHHTAGSTGLLVYVSLFERMAAVIGDEAVVEKLGPDALDELCKQLTDGLKSGKPAEAFCAAIRSAGERLAPVLPRTSDDVNELPDALVILD